MSYNQGQIDALQKWGSACGKQPNCEACMINSVKGDGLTCQEFAAQFPAKFLSLLTEMSNSEYTFFDEYVTRFPNCNLDVDTLAEVACRKAVFEGYTGCDGGDCVSCWKQSYVGDVTESVDNSEDN